MSLSPLPTDRTIDKTHRMEISDLWLAWFGSIQFWLFPLGQNGTTAKRPTTNLYVGRPYFDTTLGKPIWVKAVSPSIVWVDATGSVV